MVRGLRGFTLIELVVVMAILATLTAISSITLFSTRQRTTMNALISSFTADVKSQQLRSMVGESANGMNASDYGVRLQNNSYVLFRDSFGTQNSVFNLPDGFEFTTPGFETIFQRGSGELAGGAGSITIRDTTNGRQKVINLNRYGIITGVN
jgi:prepilin-type N-terminal cleavage/methylation domain-containing protein